MSTVLIGNKKTDLLLKTFQTSHEPSIINLIDVNLNDSLDKYEKRQKLFKLDNYNEVLKPFPSKTFVLDELEISQLKLSLYKIYHTIWWNLYGYFFVKNTLAPYDCSDAYSFLKILWDFNILSATFLCYDSTHALQLYTFNPFTNYAPDPWQIAEVYQQENGHPFVLFRYVRANGKYLQENLNAIEFLNV